MSTVKKLLLLILLLGAFAVPAAAQDVWVRNRPFQGEVSKVGGQLQVELKALAKALELKLVEQNGGWVAGDGGGTAQAGTVLVGGKSVATTEGGSGVVLVPLKEFATAAGAELKNNADLGTIDVYVPTRTASSAGDWGANLPEKGAGTGSSGGGQYDSGKGYSIKVPSQLQLIDDPALMSAAMKYAAKEDPSAAAAIEMIDAEFFVGYKGRPAGKERAYLMMMMSQLPYQPGVEQGVVAGMAQAAAKRGGQMIGNPTQVSLGGKQFTQAAFSMIQNGVPSRMEAFLYCHPERNKAYILMIFDAEATFDGNAGPLRQAVHSFRVQ